MRVRPVFRIHGSLEDCYAIIGGTACSIILANADLDFRITKDIDAILLIENRLPEVDVAVWRLVKDGGYDCGWKSSGDVHFYRFAKPRVAGFPSMVELFSKPPPFFIEEPEGLVIVSLPVGDEVSSPSAILLDDDYYAYMKPGRKSIDGTTVLDEVHFVPFKAKAFLDLSKRRSDGEKVDSNDIKKHKKDVFRLVQLFMLSTSSVLPDSVRGDMAEFCEKALAEGILSKQMGILLTPEEGIGLLPARVWSAGVLANGVWRIVLGYTVGSERGFVAYPGVTLLEELSCWKADSWCCRRPVKFLRHCTIFLIVLPILRAFARI